MLKIDPPPKIITFDCYGTLVQWHEAMRNGVHDIVHGRSAVNLPEDRVVAIADRLRAIAGELQPQSPFCEYEKVLRASLKQAMSEAGHEVIAADVETLRARLVAIPGSGERMVEALETKAISRQRPALPPTASVWRIGKPRQLLRRLCQP